ncbi:MAG: response regulator transcription factor [Gammaproteobacteria bacterium]|nr:response regulator transcription factor [Gammaproteobacteria bacterium]
MKILIVDDHQLFREGLVYILQSLEEGVTFLQTANYDGALNVMDEHADLDMVLLDLKMPGLDGFSLLETARISYPKLPIAVLSATRDRKEMQRAIDLCAVGFIPKDTSGKLLKNAVRLMLDGGMYLPPEMADQGEQRIVDRLDLTPRQFDVLNMIAAGASNKLIAADLGISESTIKMHITAVFKTLGVSSRTQAALVVQEMALIRATE